jgi:hypothetical protein
MRPTLCSPRYQNVLDQVDYLINRSYIAPELARRFRAVEGEEPQVAPLDLGLGLCGRRGQRLAGSMDALSCPDCHALLRPAYDESDAIG